MSTSATRRFPARLLAVSCAALFLAGCGAIKPVPFTADEIKSRVAEDRVQMYADQEAITAPIGFHEATARALKYNLDYKLKLMETALSRSLHDVAAYEMLPHIVPARAT